MDRLEYELVTLKDNKQYLVLASLMHEYDVYDLVLNVEDENDIKIVMQEVKNGKTVLTDVDDKDILSKVAPLFEERIKLKQEGIN